MNKGTYYYNGQIRSYVLQFMAIFSGMQVQVGKLGDIEERLISVPIHYGHSDRIVAAILAENVQNKPIRLPVMSAVIDGIRLATDQFHGVGVERRNVFTPVGGLVPDDTQVIHQRMPVKYEMDMELAIYVSSTDQHFQVLEQIFLLFDPKLNIQSTDGLFDMTRLTQVTLTDIGMDTNYPIGTDRRIIQSTLKFQMPIWISAPADVRRDFVEKIFARIGVVSTAANNNYEMVAELDAQGLDYDLVASADELGFD